MWAGMCTRRVSQKPEPDWCLPSCYCGFCSASPECVQENMGKLELFLHVPPIQAFILVKAALAHVPFEQFTPCSQGNAGMAGGLAKLDLGKNSACATLNACLRELEGLDIVKEMTGQKQNRLYSCRRYMQIMNRGIE